VNLFGFSLAKLWEIDSVYAGSLDRNQFTRIARALEVYETSGKPISAFKQNLGQTVSELRWDFRAFCFTLTPREHLFRMVDLRCELMLKAGLFEEVGRLYAEGKLPPGCPASLAVGYRQALEFIRTHNVRLRTKSSY